MTGVILNVIPVSFIPVFFVIPCDQVRLCAAQCAELTKIDLENNLNSEI